MCPHLMPTLAKTIFSSCIYLNQIRDRKTGPLWMLTYPSPFCPLEHQQTPWVKGNCKTRSHYLQGNSSEHRYLSCRTHCAEPFISTIATAVQSKCVNYSSFTTRKRRRSNLAKMCCTLAVLAFEPSAMGSTLNVEVAQTLQKSPPPREGRRQRGRGHLHSSCHSAPELEPQCGNEKNWWLSNQDVLRPNLNSTARTCSLPHV